MVRIIQLGGLLNLGFAVFHLLFWRLFDWPRDLESLSQINRAVVQILNLCLTAVFLIFAYLSLFYARDLLETGRGRAGLWCMCVFWLLRAIEQIVFFGLRRAASVAFFLVFVLGASLYGYPAFMAGA